MSRHESRQGMLTLRRMIQKHKGRRNECNGDCFTRKTIHVKFSHVQPDCGTTTRSSTPSPSLGVKMRNPFKPLLCQTRRLLSIVQAIFQLSERIVLSHELKGHIC